MDCLNAVAEHAKNFGKPIEVTDEDTGNLITGLLLNTHNDQHKRLPGSFGNPT